MSKRKIEEINLTDDKNDLSVYNLDRYPLPRYKRKALNLITIQHPDISKDIISHALDSICSKSPDIQEPNILLKHVDRYLLEDLKLGQNLKEDIDPIKSILEIFPDADIEYIQAKYKELNSIDSVIQFMIAKGYTKAKKAEKKSSDEMNFEAPSWLSSLKYRENSLLELQNNYPFIRASSLFDVFSKNQHYYTPTVNYLIKLTNVYPKLSICDYPRNDFSREFISSMEEKLSKEKVSVKYFFKRKLLCDNSNSVDPIFEKELLWWVKKIQLLQEQEDFKLAEEINEKIATIEGGLIECNCCFGFFPIEKIIQCSEGHLFCATCLRYYAEETIFGKGQYQQLKCISNGENCDGIFTDSMIKRALPEKIYEKYSEEVTRYSIQEAKIENIISCFHCQYKAIFLAEAGNVFECPMCEEKTCRLCNEESHVPLRCNEVEKKEMTDKRLSVEEAMSKAKIRECPKCHTPFLKETGCNKMTCPCGTSICYICRKDISVIKYMHFCNVPHCNHQTCHKCLLYTDANQDDLLAIKEAGLSKLKEFIDSNNDLSNQKNEVIDLISTQLPNQSNIDPLLVEKLLKDPKKF